MSRCPDFLAVGHVAKDVVDGGFALGGTAAYASLTARNLGWNAGVVTCASVDLDLDQALPHIQIARKPSKTSTNFENVYANGERQQILYEVADRIDGTDVPIPWRNASIVLLAPLVHELDESLIELFANSTVGLAPQGWLRQWDDEGRVSPRAWPPAEQPAPNVHAIFLSLEDVGGSMHRAESLAALAEVAVLTQGSGGAALFLGRESTHLPAIPVREVDPTGAGDVFAAAFLIRWAETGDPREAARFANCAAGLSVTGVGLAGIPNREQVNSYLKREGAPTGEAIP